MLPRYEIRSTDLTVKRNNYELYFPEHIHKDIEIIYVRSGIQRIQIKDKKYKITAGGAAVIFPDTVHSYLGDKSEADVLILICAPKIFGSLFPNLKKLRPISPIIDSSAIPSELRFALEAIHSDKSKEITFSWMCVIMSYITGILQLETAEQPPVEDITFKLIKYLDENFTDNITRLTLARRFNVSECYISKIFTDKFNINLRNYLGLLRAEYASALIRTTDETFTEISRLSGFESIRTFNRIFKTVYGMTPKEYKNNISKMMK